MAIFQILIRGGAVCLERSGSAWNDLNAYPATGFAPPTPGLIRCLTAGLGPAARE